MDSRCDHSVDHPDDKDEEPAHVDRVPLSEAASRLVIAPLCRCLAQSLLSIVVVHGQFWFRDPQSRKFEPVEHPEMIDERPSG